MTLATVGIALRVEFSTRRAGVQIRWEQSERLRTGTMVALTPSHDMFRTTCLVAVVAARPLVNLSMNPPRVDIFLRSHADIEIDPQKEWVMVEAKGGYFEAYRYTLLALQRMYRERWGAPQYPLLPFPLSLPVFPQPFFGENKKKNFFFFN
jgi:helicase required for RNAi-mediated heterochromatin assembly 1